MKLITISTDRKIFEEGSTVWKRMVEYSRIFDEIHVVVYSTKAHNLSKDIKIAQNVFLYPTNSINRFFYIWDAIALARSICLKLSSSVAVVSTQDPFETGIVGLVLKLVYRLPLQIQLHTDFLNKYFITHSVLNLVRFPMGIVVLSFADSVRCVSERVAKSIRSISNNVSVLPILVESKTLPETKGVTDPKTINILTVCRLEEEKDLTTAIKAFKMVCDFGIDAEFVIVGDGGEREMLENLAKIYNLQTKIYFVGWQNDLAKYYQNADIYISTSLYEGYGMSIVEAGSFGLPLLLSDSGVAGFMFKDGESCLICKQGDAESFAHAMVRLIEDENLRTRLGASAQKVVEENKIDASEYLLKYKESLENAVLFYRSGGFFKKNILARYVAAGLTGASTQIGLLYIFTDIVKIWYIYSSIIAFVSAIIVSFLLQKFWTFKDGSTNKMHHQAFKYLVTAITGLIANTLLMYLFVDLIGLWYIFAQIVIGGMIMIFNFLMYKFFVFHKK